MKTTLEWLQEAKKNGHRWADAALKNYDHTHASAQPDPDTLSQAINFAFDWYRVPETYNYWAGVCKSVAPVPAPVPAMSELLESLIEDLGKLNSALENLEYNATLREPYRSQVYDATKASYEEQLAETKAEIAKMLGIEPQNERKLIGWVVQSEDGGYSKCTSPVFIKDTGEWFKFLTAGWTDITPEEAIALCGRVPEWSDEEPTPIYK